MSGLAIFRPSPQYDDLSKLAQEHFNADLSPDDRSALRAASSKASRHALIGSVLGLGLGVYAAVRLRRVRADIFAAFRGAEKPTRVVFADGRSGEFFSLFPLSPVCLLPLILCTAALRGDIETRCEWGRRGADGGI